MRLRKRVGRFLEEGINLAYSIMEELAPDPVLPEQTIWALKDSSPAEYARLCHLYSEKGPQCLRQNERLSRSFVRELGREMRFNY